MASGAEIDLEPTDEVDSGNSTQSLQIEPADRARMIAHCLRAYPEEGCGLLIGDPKTQQVTTIWPAVNAAASSKLYTVSGKDMLQADRAAESEGHEIIGVFHSHTHTDAYPSPTDVAQAPDPSWHYVIVSLRQEVAAMRSYRIVDEQIIEEPITPTDR